MENKKAELLQEHVIFIVLNISFFIILLLFIYSQSSSIHPIEETTAKKIALIIDVAKPGTFIRINLHDFFEKSYNNGIEKRFALKIDPNKNIVIISGDEESYYEYSYFNNINVQHIFKDDFLELTFSKKPEQENKEEELPDETPQ